MEGLLYILMARGMKGIKLEHITKSKTRFGDVAREIKATSKSFSESTEGRLVGRDKTILGQQL